MSQSPSNPPSRNPISSDFSVRINTYLAQQLGISRREADRVIREQKVRINGGVAVLGQRIDPAIDQLAVDGELVAAQVPDKITIALYKPRTYLTTRSDPEGRKTVMSLLPGELQHLKPAGRLDYDSEGLLLLSNDGRFIFESTHPKYENEKEYRIIFTTPVDRQLLNAFVQGVPLAEGIARADRLKQIGPDEIELVVHQGWNRQLRRMAEERGYQVARLIRTRVGNVRLDNLKPGEWRKVGDRR
ncbi:MAG: pseudouridine synthase [Chloroflexi bacterium]|nr:pseudouridine synthase [Chloroflexota bacterium]MDA1218156.1 pseudouridine synthase [Chloroflexota bacterium]